MSGDSGWWLPTTHVLGEMPLKPGERAAYEVPWPNLAGGKANKVLVYTFITVQDAEEGMNRGYYTISTESLDGSKKYTYYMNVAFAGDTVVNSGNYWLPYGDGIKPYVFVELVSASKTTHLKPKGKSVKSCKGKDAESVLREYACQTGKEDEVIVGQVFLSGYNIIPAGLPPTK